MGGAVRGMIGQIAANRLGGQASTPAPGSAYQAPSANIYSPSFAPVAQQVEQALLKPGVSGPSNITPMGRMSDDLLRAPAAPQTQQGLPPSPLIQQMMAQRTQPLRGLGALSALNNMGMGFTPRTTQSLPPMPRYVIPAYRPNMAPARESLGRVAVSVAEQQRRAAVAEAERLRAENEALQQQQYYGGLQSYYDYGGGG